MLFWSKFEFHRTWCSTKNNDYFIEHLCVCHFHDQVFKMTDNVCWIPQRLKVRKLYTPKPAVTSAAGCRFACRQADGCPFYRWHGNTCEFMYRSDNLGTEANVFAKVTDCSWKGSCCHLFLFHTTKSIHFVVDAFHVFEKGKNIFLGTDEKACVQIKVAGEYYLTGEYCPEGVDSRRGNSKLLWSNYFVWA